MTDHSRLAAFLWSCSLVCACGDGGDPSRGVPDGDTWPGDVAPDGGAADTGPDADTGDAASDVSDASEVDGSEADAAAPVVQVVDGRLSGASGAIVAVSALPVFDGTAGVPAEEAPSDGDGVRVPLSLVQAWVADDATVEAVNEALARVDGRLVATMPDVPVVLVRIPPARDAADVDAVAARLASHDAIETVERTHFAAPDVLPAGTTGTATELGRIHHLLASRTDAAWNVREALVDAPSRLPTFVVVDFFGGGVPSVGVAAALDAAAFGTGRLERHGYHVLGILAADMDSAPPEAAGVFPALVPVEVVDLYVEAGRELTLEEAEHRALRRIYEAPDQRFVLTTSLSMGCATRATARRNCSREEATAAGRAYLARVRRSGLEHRFVHVASAGNVPPDLAESDGDSAWALSAAQNSPWNAASLLPLESPDGDAMEPLGNVIVVGNARDDRSDPGAGRPPVTCIDRSSKVPFDLAAVGDEVYSLAGPSGEVATLSGTSMAAPQVAGAVGFVWALRPDLAPVAVSARVVGEPVGMSVEPACHPMASSSVLDVFDGVLAADDPTALQGGDPVDARVRGTLLDVSDGSGAGRDGRFDENDIARWLDAIDDGRTAVEYGRLDANGDGRSTDRWTARVDLDMNGIIGEAATDVGGAARRFDEAAAGDLDVLCFYAYSRLFRGAEGARDDLLERRCAPVLRVLVGSVPAPDPDDLRRYDAVASVSMRDPDEVCATDPGGDCLAEATLPLPFVDLCGASGGLPPGLHTYSASLSGRLGGGDVSVSVAVPEDRRSVEWFVAIDAVVGNSVDAQTLVSAGASPPVFLIIDNASDEPVPYRVDWHADLTTTNSDGIGMRVWADVGTELYRFDPCPMDQDELAENRVYPGGDVLYASATDAASGSRLLSVPPGAWIYASRPLLLLQPAGGDGSPGTATGHVELTVRIDFDVD